MGAPEGTCCCRQELITQLGPQEEFVDEGVLGPSDRVAEGLRQPVVKRRTISPKEFGLYINSHLFVTLPLSWFSILSLLGCFLLIFKRKE